MMIVAFYAILIIIVNKIPYPNVNVKMDIMMTDRIMKNAIYVIVLFVVMIWK